MDVFILIITIIGGVAAAVQILEYFQTKTEHRQDKKSIGNVFFSSPPNHNLPARATFIGRTQEKKKILMMLKHRHPVACIDGVGGIGKTALALEIAHLVLKKSKRKILFNSLSFKNIIWISAKDRTLNLNHVLDSIAKTINSKTIAQLPFEEKKDAINKILGSEKTLIIVDNFETVEDVSIYKFLKGIPEPSITLLTTREQNFIPTWSFSIKELPSIDGSKLIEDEFFRLNINIPQSKIKHVSKVLYDATGGSPLAIKWSVGQIKQKGQSVESVLDSLHTAKGDIFSQIFERSWGLLSVEAQYALMVIPLFYSSASRQAIQESSKLDEKSLNQALGQLAEMSLIEISGFIDKSEQSFDIHPLTRAFANNKAEHNPKFREEAQDRLIKHYINFSKTHGGAWNENGFEKLNDEIPNLIGIISYCLYGEKIAEGSQIFYNVCDFLVIHGYWNDVVELSKLAIKRNLEHNFILETARFRIWPISWIHRHRGNLRKAEKESVLALEICSSVGTKKDIAFAKRNLGRVYQEAQSYEKALPLIEDAYTIYCNVKDQHNILLTTANLASVLLVVGNVQKAWEICIQGLPKAREHGDPMRIAHLLNILGDIKFQKKETKEAYNYWNEALLLFRKAQRLDEIADTLVRIATSKNVSFFTAKKMLKEANHIYENLNIKPKSAI